MNVATMTIETMGGNARNHLIGAAVTMIAVQMTVVRIHHRQTVQVPSEELKRSIGQLNDVPMKKFNSCKNWALKYQH